MGGLLGIRIMLREMIEGLFWFLLLCLGGWEFLFISIDPGRFIGHPKFNAGFSNVHWQLDCNSQFRFQRHNLMWRWC
jgi:hypothetical protein